MEKNDEKQLLSNQIIFNVTENIERLGIKELTLEKRDFLIINVNCCGSIFKRFRNNKNPSHIKRNGSKIIPKDGNKIPIAIENAITIRRIESSLPD